MNPKLYARRRRRNSFFLILSVAAAGFGIVMLGLILGTLFYEGIGGFSPKIFTEITPPPGENGGLANAIFGSFLMSGIAVVAGTPIGILAGTYLAEYGRYTYLASIVRFVNDILLSAPSILIGLFIYQLLVIPMRGFSAWAGAAALMIIVIPVVVRTTENMLLLVPGGLREAAAALGAPQSKVIRAVTWKAAQAGMITGVLLATARILGETAPLLFTALSSQFENYDLGQPMANLPVVIFQFANSPFEDWQRLAWAGALLITLTVLTLSILARLLESKNRGQN